MNDSNTTTTARAAFTAIQESLEGACSDHVTGYATDCYICDAYNIAANAMNTAAATPTVPTGPTADDLAAALDTVIGALDDASSVVDAGEDEEYAYQAELEGARELLRRYREQS
jgi:hypothetical protein